MKRILLIALALLALASPVLATDVTISASQQSNLSFNPANIGSDQNFTASVTTSSTSVTITGSPLLPNNVVGRAGFQVLIGGSQYVVAGVANSSTLTLTSPYLGASGTTTLRLYKFVILRVYCDQAFTPLGANYVVQSGAIGSANFYKEIAVSIINSGSGNVAYYPAFTIPATTDAPVNNTSRYTFAFYNSNGGSLNTTYTCDGGITQFAVPPSTPTSLINLCSYNGAVSIQPDASTYTRQQIDGRFANCSAGQSWYFAASGNIVSCLNFGSGLTLVGNTLTAGTGATGLMTRQAINVKTDYACVGDGVTDDTTCLDNAAAAAAAATGKIIYVPAGTYRRTGTWTIPGGVTVEGDGMQKSIIYSTSNAVIISAVEGSGAYATLGPTIRSIKIQGSKTAGSSQIGLKVDASPYMAQVTIEHVQIYQAGAAGFYVGNAFSSRFVDVYSDDNAGYPFLFNSANMPSNHYENLYAQTVNSGGNAGFRVLAGNFICISCNGINGSAAGSYNAILGQSIAQGDSANVSVYAQWINSNFEAAKAVGIGHRYNSVSTFTGHNQFSGDGGSIGSYKALVYEVDSASFPPYFAKGIADGGLVFADSPASFYANSMPIWADDLPPLTVTGQGAKIAGGASQTAYYNSTTARSEQLYRADALYPPVAITTSTSFLNPGAHYYEVTCVADCTLTLPWPGWYLPAGEPVVVKNLSTTGIIVTIDANSGGTVNGSSVTIGTQGQSVTLIPNSTALDYRTTGQFVSNAVSGTGTAPRLAYWSGTNVLTSTSGLEWDNANGALLSPGRFWGINAAAGAPTHSFTNDTTTGMYLAGASTNLGFAVNGSEKFDVGLTSSFFDTHVTPASSNANDLGSASLRWRTGYFATSVLLGVPGSGVGALQIANGANSNLLTISVGATSTAYTLTPPLAPPASTQCLQMSSAGAITTTGSACGGGGGGGTDVWSDLLLPSANLALTMAGYTSTFTWNATTGALTNLFTLRDTAANTGTGYILAVNTGAGSAAKPVSFTASGTANGVEMTTGGVLQVLGTGGITANALNGVSGDGIQVRTSAGNFTSRAVTASVGIGVSNGDGVAGPPTVSWTPQTLVANATLWDSANASRTLTIGLSGATDPVLTFSDGVVNLSTGALQVGGAVVPTISSTSTFTNKTLTSSTNVLGGVTMTLGSDATGDIYYRNAGGQLTRLAIGTVNYVLTVIGGIPSWQPGGGGGGGSIPVSTRVSSNYTALTSDFIIVVDATASAYTITLYSASGNAGKIIGVVKEDTGTNLVNVSAGSSYSINNTGGILWFESDGTNWKTYGN